ncbi:nuclear transport factor 2 family protein [Persicitalea sp.]|uniref:nuclear transport factor 2 family protein n=1 Tax=Persicitalea sp. TaxID=3100273 RepID=UPI003593AC75
MKKKILFVLMLGMTLSVAMAQSKEEKAVLDRVEMWRKAVVGQDVKTLDKVFADEMTYGHSNGHLDTKATFVGTIKDEKEVYKELNLDDMTVSVVGNTALVRHKMTGTVNLADGTVSKPNLGVLQVWSKTKSGWQLLARQAFKL